MTDRPFQILTVATPYGNVRIRSEASYYAIDEQGQTLDGPFETEIEATEVATIFLREKQAKAASQAAPTIDPARRFRKRYAILPSSSWDEGVLVGCWIYDDSPISEDDEVEQHLHIVDLQESPCSDDVDGGRYLLTIMNESYQSDDLAELERILSVWQREERMPFAVDQAIAPVA